MSLTIEEGLNFFKSCEIIDLSYTLEEGMPSYPTQSKYFHMKWPILGDPSVSYQFLIHEHNGTHVDSPCHFIKDERHPHHITIDEISLLRFMGRCLMLDFSHVEDPYLVRRNDIQDWENKHMKIMKDDVVLFYFGLSKKWSTGSNGEDFLQKWPGISRGASEYFVQKKVNAVGTDAISIDGSNTREFIAHYTLLGNNILIFECLNQLDRLPVVSIFLTLPLKIKDGTASPVRAVSFVHKK